MTVILGRGRLTDADRAKILVLADEGKKAPTISREIRKHPSTVHWYMLTQGLVKLSYREGPGQSYMRNGRMVHRFTRDEDVLLETLRLQNFNYEQIAKAVSNRFGTARSKHTVKLRLIMLAAMAEAEAL